MSWTNPSRRFPKTLQIVFLIILLPALAPAQGPGSRGDTAWGAGGAYQRLYDPSTVETFRGTILAVDTFFLGRGGRGGIHLQVMRGADTVPVHLGPAWYLQDRKPALAVWDTVTIEGSRTTFDGRPAVIAAKVMRGPDTLRLRDSRGFPAWGGGRGGRGRWGR